MTEEKNINLDSCKPAKMSFCLNGMGGKNRIFTRNAQVIKGNPAMSDKVLSKESGYKNWPCELKSKIRQWYLFYSGHKPVGKQPVGQSEKELVVPIISQEGSLPASARSSLTPFGKQVVAQITGIPWGHNIAIISGCGDIKEALYYVRQTLQNSDMNRVRLV